LAMVTGGYLFTYQEKLRLNLTRIAHTQETLSNVHDLQNNLCGAEVCTTGYLKTGDAGQLAAYQVSAQEIDRIYKRLQKLTGDKPEQQRLLAELEPLINRRLEILKKSLDLRRQTGSETPAHAAIAQEGMEIQNKILKIVDRLEHSEKDLLGKELAEEQTKAKIWLWGLTLGTFLSFSLLLLNLYFLQREIADRRQAEEALRDSEAMFRNLLEFIPGMSVQGYGPDGTVRYWNKASEEVYGYTAQEAVGQNLGDLIIPPEIRWHFAQALEIGAKATRSGEFMPPGELMLLRQNGSLVPVYSIHTVVRLEGKDNLLFCIDVDLSERKKVEEALQKAHDELERRVEERTAELKQSEEKLRALTSQILTAQERERLRIARELHDEMGQALLVLKLQMSAIKDSLRQDQEGLAQEVQHSLNYLDGVIDNVRRLSRDLSPSTLEELGLTSAIKFLINGFCKHYNVESADYESDEIDDLFPMTTQINIYRIFQECLTNIGKHARASNISVSIKKKNGTVAFLLADNGKGFSVDEVLARPALEKGLGLATMYERVRMFGGSFQIWSEKDSGTLISFTIPIEQRENRSRQ
jgi:PAS domain S-box-containing protein